MEIINKESTVNEKVLSENQIKKANNCKDYSESELGHILTGKMYKPRKKKEKLNNNMTIFNL